jgi:6-pyruvoyl-tetrahydropterin synthase
VAEQTIAVRHNVEMGHRLSLQPDSKCFHLHGHSWWIDLKLTGPVDETGMVENFAKVKSLWRGYLDGRFDHHMVLNIADPLIALLPIDLGQSSVLDSWGITLLPFDPTVENMARHWGVEARHMFQLKVEIKVQEAATNAAYWRS